MDVLVVLLGLAFALSTVIAYKKHCDVIDLREEIKDADAKIAALLNYVDALQSPERKKSIKKTK